MDKKPTVTVIQERAWRTDLAAVPHKEVSISKNALILKDREIVIWPPR